MLPTYLSGPKAIGVIALSSPSEASRLARGVSYLEALGVPVKVALEPCAAYGKTEFLFSSDSPKRRAQALVDFAKDPTIGAILAARGAYGALEVLPELDFEILKKFPKPLVGFSDTTALLVALQERAGWPCIHGPSLESAFSKAFEGGDPKLSADGLLSLLRGTGNPVHASAVRLLGSALAEGRVVSGSITGGNLSSVASLVGTPFQPKLNGKLLFLEEISEKPYRIHRQLLQMSIAGMFQGVHGVLLGDFSGCEHEKGLGPNLDDVLKDVFGALGIPVFQGIRAGHVALNLPVPFGVNVALRRGNLGQENALALQENDYTIHFH